MAILEKELRIWNPFDTNVEPYISGNEELVIDSLNFPKFYLDWNVGKFRNSLSETNISFSYPKYFDLNIFGNPSVLYSAGAIGTNYYSNYEIPNAFSNERLEYFFEGAAGNYVYISFWVKITSQTPGDSNTGHSLFMIHFDDPNANSQGLGAYVDINGYTGIHIKNQIYHANIQINSPLDYDKWYHVSYRIETDPTSYLILRDPGDPLRGFENNAKAFVNGIESSTTISSEQTIDYFDYSIFPYEEKININYQGPHNSTGNFTSSGFEGYLGNILIWQSESPTFAKTLYNMSLYGGQYIEYKSGIHSFSERWMKTQQERIKKYPHHYGGLDINYNGKGASQFNDNSELSWNSEDPLRSFVPREGNKIPYLGLDSSDPAIENYRSPNKSIFFSQDLSEFNIDTQGRNTSQELYERLIPETKGILPFKDDKCIGDYSDISLNDRIVIEIPLEIMQDLVLGNQHQPTTNFPSQHNRDKDLAYYNFSTGEFQALDSDTIAFSPAQGVLIEPEMGFGRTLKNLARPTSQKGFPSNSKYQQDEGTLKLEKYLKDAFILEGYELILEVETSEEEITNFNIGIGHKFGSDLGYYKNDFGVPIPSDGTEQFKGTSFFSKIFTSFLMRQTIVKPSKSQYENHESIGTSFSSVSNAYNDLEDISVNLENLKISSLEPYETINKNRELIGYGQTVIRDNSRSWSSYNSAKIPYHQDFGISAWQTMSGDKGQFSNIRATYSDFFKYPLALRPAQDFMEDREQFIYVDDSNDLYIGTNFTMNHLVFLKDQKAYLDTIPIKEYHIWSSESRVENFYDQAGQIFNENDGKWIYDEEFGNWQGGCNIYEFVESRSGIGATGVVNGVSKTENLSPKFVYIYSDQEETTSLQTKIGEEYTNTISEPIGDLQNSYVLYPEDELILGIQNSVSQIKNSVLYLGSPQNEIIDDAKLLHSNNMSIKQGKGTLRLFGRYKREEKFVTPTSNFSLYHNVEANEPIGNEDIHDVYELEPVMSYTGSMRDDIVLNYGDNSLIASFDLKLDGFDTQSGIYLEDCFIDPKTLVYDFEGYYIEYPDPNYYPNYVWQDLNSQIFPGIAANLDGTVNSTGQYLAPVIYWNPHTAPGAPLNYRQNLQFVTNNSNLIWVDSIGEEPPYRKGGIHIEELSRYGYDTNTDNGNLGADWTDPSGTNPVSRIRDINNFPSQTFNTSLALSNYQISIPIIFINSEKIYDQIIDPSNNESVNTYGFDISFVKFVPVVIDYDNPPQIDGNPLTVGDSFFFPIDDHNGNPSINTGKPIKFDDNSNVSQWSNHFYLSSSSEILNIFVVVGKSSAEPANWNYIPVDGDTGNAYYAVSSTNRTSLQWGNFYQIVLKILDIESGNNSALLYEIPYDSNSGLYDDKLRYPSTVEFYRIFNIFNIGITGITAFMNAKMGIGSYTGNYPGGNPVVSQVYLDKSKFLSHVYYVNNDPATGTITELIDYGSISWATYPFYESEMEIISDPIPSSEVERDMRRRIVARTTEDIPVFDFFGESPGNPEFGGGYRTAGPYGNLKKILSLPADLEYLDSKMQKISNSIEIFASNNLETDWLFVNSDSLEKWNWNEFTRDSMKITYTYSLDLAGYIWPSTGAYSRWIVSNINPENGVIWPTIETDEDQLIEVKNYIDDEFPEISDVEKTYGDLVFSLGSGIKNKIYLYPKKYPLKAISPSGPIDIALTYQYAPIRGFRYGLINNRPSSPSLKFSSTSFGQPRDLLQGYLDSSYTSELSDLDIGAPVRVTSKSRTNTDITMSTSSKVNTPGRLNQDIYCRVTYPWIDDSADINYPPMLAPWRSGYEESGGDGTNPVAQNSNPLVRKDNLRVDVVGSIKKKAALLPGNIQSRIIKP